MLVCTVYIYYHTLIQTICYYSIGASLQSGVQQLTELPEWTKHASTVHCTVQLYSTTIVLLSTAVHQSTTVPLQYNTQYNTTANTIAPYYSTNSTNT